MNHHAYRINVAVEQLAIEEGDIFVQSPFNKCLYVLARLPKRKANHIRLIEDFIHMYDEIYVTSDEIPELIENWKECAAAERDANLKLVDKLREQIDFIQSQITDAQENAANMERLL